MLLHLEHLDPAMLRRQLPGISETIKIFTGIALEIEPVPVLPTAHYNMGGISTNIHGEVLDPTLENPKRVFPGLMAVGEAACVSVHGATRLGTNSLLDLIVFGRAAAQRAAAIIERGAAHCPLPPGVTEHAIARFDLLRNAAGSTPVAELRLEMQRTMQDHCAVFRTSDLLERGIHRIVRVTDGVDDLGIGDHSLIWNTDLVDAIEFDNLLSQSIIVLRSALFRTESRGAHAREDYPQRDDANWLRHTLACRNANGAIRLGTRPVHLHPLSNDVTAFPPRVY